MMSKSEELANAHLDFIRHRRYDDGGEPSGDLSVTLARSLLEIKIGRVFSRDDVAVIVKEVLCSFPENSPVKQFIKSSMAGSLKKILSETSHLGAILPEEIAGEFIDTLLGMNNLRKRVFRRIFDTAVYSRMISEVLYKGIKDFILYDNIVARAIPGAVSAIRLGQDLVRSLPGISGLESSIDRKLTDFVENNIKAIIRHGEKILNERFDEDLPGLIKNKLLAYLSSGRVPKFRTISKHGSEDVKILNGILKKFWMNFTTTDIFSGIVEIISDELYLNYSSRTVKEIFNDFGLSEDDFFRIINDFTAAVRGNSLLDDFIQNKIQRSLEEFYSSEDAGRILQDQ